MVEEKPPRRLVMVYATLVLALLVLSVLAAIYDRFPGDLEITREIQGLDLAWLTSAMRFSTDMTSPRNSLVTLFAVVSIWMATGHARFALFSAGALLVHAIGGAIKVLVDRARPDGSLVETVRFEEDFSYPSGHTEWVVSFEGFLVFAIWKLTPNRLIRAGVTGLWLVHLALTSAGRVDQGLHWPSDIVASYLVGAIALLTVVWLYRVAGNLQGRLEDDGRTLLARLLS